MPARLAAPRREKRSQYDFNDALALATAEDPCSRTELLSGAAKNITDIGGFRRCHRCQFGGTLAGTRYELYTSCYIVACFDVVFHAQWRKRQLLMVMLAKQGGSPKYASLHYHADL